MASSIPVSTDEERVRLTLRDDRRWAFGTGVRRGAGALDAQAGEYLVMGGIASSCLGRERWTHDIDVFTRPRQARRAVAALARVGLETDETDPEWAGAHSNRHGRARRCEDMVRAGSDLRLARCFRILAVLVGSPNGQDR